MSPLAELLPFVFLGMVIAIFLPTGNISTRSGVRPLSVPYTGNSLRSPSFVAGFMANFLDFISHLVAAFRGATISFHDLCTTSVNRIFNNAESPATAHTHPYGLLRSNTQAVGWAGLNRMSFDILSSLEDSLDAQPFESIYIQHCVTSLLLTILSHPNAITPGARANVTDRLMQNETPLLNEEYLDFTFSNHRIVAEFIIATGNQVSPVVIGLLHLAWSDPEVALAFRHFSYDPPDNYNHHVSGLPSIRQIAHSVHCQSPVWPSKVPFSLSDDEVEIIAALFAVAIFTFHDKSFALITK